jgi:hypothetical protein
MTLVPAGAADQGLYEPIHIQVWLEWKRAGLDPDASLLQAYTRVLAEARPGHSSWRTSTR